jgi:hypothetical protein
VRRCLLPAFGAEGEDVASGLLADAREHVAQVLEGVDAVQLAGGDERVDARRLGALVAYAEEPVPAPTAMAPELARSSMGLSGR